MGPRAAAGAWTWSPGRRSSGELVGSSRLSSDESPTPVRPVQVGSRVRDGGWSWKLSALLSADQLHSWLGTDCETRVETIDESRACGEGWTHRKSIICARWYYGSHPSEPTVRAARYGLPCRPRQAGCRAAGSSLHRPTPVAPRHGPRRALQTDESTREPRPTLTSSLPRPLQREDLGLPCSSSDRGLHSRLYWEEVRCRASRVGSLRRTRDDVWGWTCQVVGSCVPHKWAHKCIENTAQRRGSLVFTSLL